ncbi:hypothetical protein M407DRAFT_91086 [Tulasnella calospora MUT 4182]|uniref:MARVEL domain-containing protein n=1 Tax=Tulasnella calospora MUT 4182 TaxID=1051891 RepID=A0A0C3QUC3_9AGAM|nr:hypothetical protein M407DRAFT_91086 [Tulasnella calospora MUT 4182]
MRHIIYPILLAVLLTFPAVVLGITAHFQSYAVRYEHKFQVPFSYIIGISCLTVLGAMTHLASLILELEASASGFGFRKTVREAENPITILLVPFWLGVVGVIGTKQGMERIGGCISNPPDGYDFADIETNSQLCTEWAISLGFAVTTTVAVVAWWFMVPVGMSQDAFVSRIWQRRQQQANRAKGIVPPPAIAPAGAAQAQNPPATTQPLAAGPVSVQQPPLTIPPNVSAPQTSTDIEALAGRGDDNSRHASSDPMTMPASPPPSAQPSWIQPSTAIGPLNEQVPGTAVDSNVPASPAAPPQATTHTS